MCKRAWVKYACSAAGRGVRLGREFGSDLDAFGLEGIDEAANFRCVAP
jgi:hypothetical protein